jgi:hypothetical protein
MSATISASHEVNRQHTNAYGALPILGSILQFIAGVGVQNRSGEFSPQWAVALFLIGCLLLIPGVLGIRAAGAYKNSRAGKAGTLLTIIGQVTWAAGAIYILINPAQEWDQPLTPLGAMLSSLGMILIGVSVIRAGVWTDWRRFAPILVPAYYFLFVLPLQFLVFIPKTDDVNFYLLGTWYLTWSVVGVALLKQHQS